MHVQITTAFVPIQEILKKRGLEPGGNAERAVAQKALELCTGYVPKQTGRLLRSGHITVGGIRWETPYAKAVYYGKNGDRRNGLRGPYWAMRMKADRMMELCEAAAAAAGGKRR